MKLVKLICCALLAVALVSARGDDFGDFENLATESFVTNCVSNAMQYVITRLPDGSIHLGTNISGNGYNSFIWNPGGSQYTRNESNVFAVNPTGGAEGFYIGATNLVDTIENIAGKAVPVYTNVTCSISNDVFMISTNDVVVWESTQLTMEASDIVYAYLESNVVIPNTVLSVDGYVTNVVTRQDNGAVVLMGNFRTNGISAGPMSFLQGIDSMAPGFGAHAEGYHTQAVGHYSHAEGSSTEAHGAESHAEGDGCKAFGYSSHAEGMGTTASNAYAHAEGAITIASGEGSHAEGCYSVAKGLYSYAGGYSAYSTNDYAFTWQGDIINELYGSHGNGTFNVNPVGGIKGFYIGATNLEDHIKGLAPAPTPVPTLPDKRVAMFVIPVNNESDASPKYVGFELKASTNNFSSATADDVRLQFYSQSDIADEGHSPNIDKMWLYVGAETNSAAFSDYRSYHAIPNTLLYEPPQLHSVVVLVDTTRLIRHPESGDSKWLLEDNEELIWCYLRTRNHDPAYERVEDTDRPLWRPIAPVRWFKKMPEWATSQMEAMLDE